MKSNIEQMVESVNKVIHTYPLVSDLKEEVEKYACDIEYICLWANPIEKIKFNVHNDKEFADFANAILFCLIVHYPRHSAQWVESWGTAEQIIAHADYEQQAQYVRYELPKISGSRRRGIISDEINIEMQKWNAFVDSILEGY